MDARGKNLKLHNTQQTKSNRGKYKSPGIRQGHLRKGAQTLLLIEFKIISYMHKQEKVLKQIMGSR